LILKRNEDIFMDTKDVNFHSQVPGNDILAGSDSTFFWGTLSGASPLPYTTQLILGMDLIARSCLFACHWSIL
jgi:hypothetical protein